MNKNNEKKKESIFTLVIALVLALLFRSFLFEPFNIPSGSMKPTLLVGDFLFVEKYEYGFSRYSFPFGFPSFEGRIFAKEPKRGDVIVFKKPNDTSINYIKRLIGLPGDKIEVRNSILYINDKEVPRKKISKVLPNVNPGIDTVKYIETLPNGVSYHIYDDERFGSFDNVGPYIVPAGKYFMMGDNRDNSADSRADVGFVPYENFVGKASLIFFSTSSLERFYKMWDWFIKIRTERLFNFIDNDELGKYNQLPV